MLGFRVNDPASGRSFILIQQLLVPRRVGDGAELNAAHSSSESFLPPPRAASLPLLAEELHAQLASPQVKPSYVHNAANLHVSSSVTCQRSRK